MQVEIEKEKIELYIKGLADKSVAIYVESLFLEGDKNEDLKHLLYDDWNLVLRDTSPSENNLKPLLDSIHHIIRKKESERKQKPFRKFIRIYMKAAAILLLPLLVAGELFFYYRGNPDKSKTEQIVTSTIYSPMGSRVSFNLPDGTKGMLNSGSKLSYSLPFTSNRRVKLEGEAWFEVNNDKAHPFEISTGNSTVKVLGTSFNMCAYPEDGYVEVVLKEGKVEFKKNKDDQEVTLLPSERLVYQDGVISKSIIDPAKYNAWTEGKLVFKGDPITEVIRRIERLYNVKVNLADKELEEYSFRATFQDDNLENVLWYLSLTSPIRYQITPRRILVDGSYENEKVTIYLKK